MKILQLTVLCCLLLCSNLLYAQLRAKSGKGYFNITNIAELRYEQSIDSTQLKYAHGYVKDIAFSVSTINGWFVNPNISIGLGVGLQFSGYKAFKNPFAKDTTLPDGYFDDRHQLTLLPIFADFRFCPQGFGKGWMFILNAGYAPLLKIDHELDKMNLDGGALVKLGAAYPVSLGETISLIPSLNFNANRFGHNTAIGANVGLGIMF